MKKTLLIALAGLMLIAFTQCNKGSKEYKEGMKALNEYKQNVEKAKSCEDLVEVANKLQQTDFYKNFDNYAEKDRMTQEERAKFEKFDQETSDLFDKKADELCPAEEILEEELVEEEEEEVVEEEE